MTKRKVRGVMTYAETQTRKARRWLTAHVFLVYRFRTAFKLEQETTDLQEKNRLNQKIRHLDKKLEEHIAYGESIDGFTGDRIRQLTTEIVEKVRKGKCPKIIVQELTQEMSQN